MMNGLVCYHDDNNEIDGDEEWEEGEKIIYKNFDVLVY